MINKIIFFAILLFLINKGYGQQTLTQTKTASNVIVNHNPESWIDKSALSFAADDNKYAYTKTSFGQFPIFFDHFEFDIPANANIAKLVCTVRKFKTGRSEVKDYNGTTWFLARCNCSFTPDCNCDYGPVMHDLNAWSTKETAVNYEQAGTGSFTRTTTNPDGTKNVETINYQWTPEKINDPMFGFTFNPTIKTKGGGAAIYIDQLAVTVYYTLPTTKITESNFIKLKQHSNLVTVTAKHAGKYKLTVTDRFGRTLQQNILRNGMNEQVQLNNRCKGYCVITVEGNGQKKSMQVFIY